LCLHKSTIFLKKGTFLVHDDNNGYKIYRIKNI
jgi:hypothetical protein